MASWKNLFKPRILARGQAYYECGQVAYTETLKREVDRACDRKHYRHVAAHLDKLKTYPNGQEEANTLAAYRYVYHKNCPAMKDELKKAGYPQK